MTLYIGRRLLQAVAVLWAAYTVSFIVLYALPADPVSLLAGSDATDISAAQLDELRQRLGLDRPLIVQYFTQLGDVLHGDLGTSIVTGRPVTTILAEAIPPTLQIAAAGFVLAVRVRRRHRVLRDLHPQQGAVRLPDRAAPARRRGAVLLARTAAHPVVLVRDPALPRRGRWRTDLDRPPGDHAGRADRGDDRPAAREEPGHDAARALHRHRVGQGRAAHAAAPAAWPPQRGPAGADHDGPDRGPAAGGARSSPRRSSPGQAWAG